MAQACLDRLRLVVRVNNSHEVSYPLELGSYTLGSNSSCMIRLEGSDIEDIHAALSISTSHGFSVENLAQKNPILRDGVPVEGKQVLGAGEVLTLGSYEIRLKELEPPVETAVLNVSAGARDFVKKLLIQLRRGLPGYDDLLEQLAPIVSPTEARTAQHAVRQGTRALMWSLILLTVLQLGSALLPAGDPNLSGLLYDLAGAGFLAASLFLVSYYRVNIAGRTLIPLLWFLRFCEPPMGDWYAYPHFLWVVGDLSVALAVGLLIDFGASSEPGRRLIPLRRVCLVLMGLLAIRDAIVESKWMDGWQLGLSFAAGILCILWSWWPGPWLERQSKLQRSEGILDEELVRLIGMRRWSRVALGRIFAVALGILPALLFFHSFQIKARLTWPESGQGAILTRASGGDQQVWFWKQKGRLLQPSDLDDPGLYGFLHLEVPEDRRKQIETLAQNLYEDATDHASYQQLEKSLAPYDVDAERLEKIFSNLSLVPDKHQQSLYYLEARRLRPQGPFVTDQWIYSGRDQLFANWQQFEGYTKDEIENRESNSAFRRFVLIACGVLGLMVLWRRGGDWGLAFWLGVWLIGAATMGAYRYSLLFIPAVVRELWERALINPGYNLLLNLFLAVDLITMVNLFLFAAFLPCAAVWSWICWPTDSSYWRQRISWSSMLSGRLYLPVLVLKTLTVTALMSFIFWGGALLIISLTPEADWSNDLAFLVASILFVTISFLVGYQRKRRLEGGMLKPLDWGSGLLFLIIQPLILLTTPELALRSVALRTLGFTLISVFVIIMLLLVVKRGFLRLFTIHDASVIITAFTILLVFKLSEELFEVLIRDLSQGVRIPDYGANVLGLSASFLVIPPIHRRIERLLLYLSFARITTKPRLTFTFPLDSIERKIDRTLELLLDTRNPHSVGQVRKALSACGVKQYAFFARRRKLAFESSVLCLETDPPDQLYISRMLLKFFEKKQSLIDLERLAFDPKLVFVQFEIERLRRAIPARYLLPILLGGSVRGLLFVYAVEEERALAGEQVTSGVADVGLLTTQLRYRHSSLG